MKDLAWRWRWVLATLAVGCGDKAASGGGGVDLSCEQSSPVLQPDGSPSGFETCDDALTHRAEPVTCVAAEPPATCEAISGAPSSCQSSTDCTERPHGACLDDGIIDPGASQGCRCVYGCETDADCGAGTVCACLGGRPQCIGGTCQTDADCEGLCITHVTSGACGGTSTRLVCLDPDDECSPQPGSCPEIENCNGVMQSAPCIYTEQGWRCGDFECATSCG